MLIKFANTDVEAWKVRQGVVVMVNDGYGNFVYGHVSNIASNKLVNNYLDLVITCGNQKFYEHSRDCTWLEPH